MKVSERGLYLAERTPGADETVIQLFGFLHDCQRKTEGIDQRHGLRAGEHIKNIRNNLLKGLTDDQFEKLEYAITFHNAGLTDDDPTIGCCWDADRLEIGRVGMRIKKRFMSTEAGKRLAR